MKLGLVVKLRPAGPWRIGPDSGARNRVDFIYHSDSLYSAVTSAMARVGMLEAWLDATARTAKPAVCFSSSFPYLDEITFVVPPRTLWPPAARGLATSRVRWKSARFVPLTVVKSILAGERLNENQWSVDGASGCLVPVGRAGPFRTGVRWSAGVDRLTGACERHSTACIEFRPGCGLWTIAGFSDEAAGDRWREPVKAAFRLLADTGFGGERSRGWGRSETPEFSEGLLPEMIIETPAPRAAKPTATELEPEPALPPAQPEAAIRAAQPEAALPPAQPEPALQPAQPEPALPPAQSEPAIGAATVRERLSGEPEAGPVQSEPEVAPVAEPEPVAHGAPAEAATLGEPQSVLEPPAPTAVPSETPSAEPASPAREAEIADTPTADESASERPSAEPELAAAEAKVSASQDWQAEAPAPPSEAISAIVLAPDPIAPMRIPAEPTSPARQAHWLLSLFSPAATDTVDWARGNYTVLARGGRIDSPAGSGELKKQIQMVAEGSVLFADAAPLGAAPDVAPDGFAHPVFRAGFALAIPLPEVH